MKKISIIVLAIISLVCSTITVNAQTVEGKPESDREQFAHNIYSCTAYMAEGEGELAAIAFGREYSMLLYSLDNPSDLPDQRLIVYDMASETIIYDLRSGDALTLEMIEQLLLIYDGETVPSTLFNSRFKLETAAPLHLFNWISSQRNCTVLWYGA